MEKTVLIVCRNLSEVGLISRVFPKTGYRYILASDDPGIHKIGRQQPWISEVCWLEQVGSSYSVSDKVIEINKLIDQWLMSLVVPDDSISPELLSWPCIVEGGMTTQRIQDALLLINSYLHLIQTYHVAEIILLPSWEMGWEDEVLVEIARSRSILVKVIGRFQKNVIISRIKAFLKNAARQPYYIAGILSAKLKNNGKDNGKQKFRNETAFQLCGSNDKHVENILPIMNAMKNKGYDSLALCWRATEAGLRIQREGFPSIILEKYVPFISIGVSLYIAFRMYERSRRSFRDFSTGEIFSYKNVPLARLLWPSIVFFFSAEVPQRYMLKVAIEKYFHYHSPLAIKLWACGAVFESSIIIRRNRHKKIRPLYMTWGLGVIVNDPYDSNYADIDLFLVSGSRHAAYLKMKGFLENRITTIGMSRYDRLFSFKRNYNPKKSRDYLGIPQTYSFYILHDAGAVVRGYYSSKEQIEAMDKLLYLAKDHTSIALLIKPHPSHHSGMLEYLIDSYDLDNVFMIEKTNLPYHAINAVDLVLTKFSTIGLEAMFLERPFISLIFDGEERFKIFDQATEYVMSSEECLMLLTKLTEDPTFFEKWRIEQIRRHKEFLKEYSVDDSRPAAELAAVAIDQHIKRHYSLKSNAEKY